MKPSLQNRPPLMQLTEAAAHQIHILMQKRGPETCGIRISVKSKGCVGLAYTLEYVEVPLPTDEKIEVHGVTVYVDPKAVLYVIGTTMDFQQDNVSSGFIFQNPNEKGRCGCGESFHV